MKKFKIISIIICLILLTGCGCSKQNSDDESKRVQPIKLSSIKISTGDIGFKSLHIDNDGNEDDIITLDSTSNILVSTSPMPDSDDYEFIYSKKGIIQIDKDFNIKPLKVGKTTITAKSTDGSNIESNKITIEVVKE